MHTGPSTHNHSGPHSLHLAEKICTPVPGIPPHSQQNMYVSLQNCKEPTRLFPRSCCGAIHMHTVGQHVIQCKYLPLMKTLGGIKLSINANND